jgi:predicted transcriptional regulator
MRTTLTLDDDVAAAIEQLRASRDQTLTAIVNEALRLGLQALTTPPTAKERFRTRALDLGECFLPNLDNIGEVLAFAEGEDYR